MDEKDQGKKEGTKRSRDEEGSRDEESQGMRKGQEIGRARIIETASLFV